MTVVALCRDICKVSEALPIPEGPPPWGGGGTTPPIDPTILAVTCPTIPSTAVVGTPTTIRVIGQNFTTDCKAFLDNVQQTTTFVSATELTFSATGTVAKTSTITVKDIVAGTTATGTCQFIWTAAAILTMVCPCVPATAAVGSPLLPVTVKGTLFNAGCVIMLDGVDQITTYVSPTSLQFTANPVPETARIATVSVKDPVAGTQAVTTCPFEFTQTLIVPTITSVRPDMIGLSDPVAKLITVTGTNFDATSVITMNYFDDIPTTFVNATTLTAQPNPTTNGTVSVRVMNGGVRSNQSPTSVSFMVVNNPVVNSLVPPSVPIGGADITLKVLGGNFGNTAKILLDGVEVPTIINSSGSASCTIRPSIEPVARSMEVTVRLGHDPAHIDDVLPVGPPLQFQFT